MVVVSKLKRLVTAPTRLSRRQALVLLILLVIFGSALYMRLSLTLGQGLPLGRDGPYYLFHLRYLAGHYPSNPFLSAPPITFHSTVGLHALLSMFGSSLLTSSTVAPALFSALIVPTTFLMMKRLTKNNVTSLTAAFLAAFIPANFRMMGELIKNSFAVSLAPLSVFFLWRGLQNGKKLDLILSGIMLGIVGLTHQLVFGTLVIAYISYLALLLAYRKRIPWRELKVMIIVAITTALICGYYYIGEVSSITSMGGGGKASAAMIQGEAAQGGAMMGYYNDFIGQLLLILAVIGAGVAAYRRKPTDLFLLAWGMSFLIMAQPWTDAGYHW